MKKQVDKNSYNFSKYCDLDRWSSYWYQIKEVLACSPKTVLEIGVGNKVLADYLKNNTDIVYKSLDVAEDLEPDFIASVDDLSIVKENSFDTVCAFEVLEHLPFDKFEKCLLELKRVSKKDVIISLPHWGRHFSFEFRLPFFKKIKKQYKFNGLSIEHKFDGQHYWEIGKRSYSLKKIKSIIEKSGLKIKKDYICFNSPYHHFFILGK
jgi:ubiquinone/menaquinone biosynthesis C-methylase UbiE